MAVSFGMFSNDCLIQNNCGATEHLFLISQTIFNINAYRFCLCFPETQKVTDSYVIIWNRMQNHYIPGSMFVKKMAIEQI